MKDAKKVLVAACIGGAVAAAVNSFIAWFHPSYVRVGGMLLRERVTVPEAAALSLAAALALGVLLLAFRAVVRRKDGVFCIGVRVLLAAAVLAPVFMDIDTVKSRVAVAAMNAVAFFATMLALRKIGGFRPGK